MIKIRLKEFGQNLTPGYANSSSSSTEIIGRESDFHNYEYDSVRKNFNPMDIQTLKQTNNFEMANLAVAESVSSLSSSEETKKNERSLRVSLLNVNEKKQQSSNLELFESELRAKLKKANTHLCGKVSFFL